LNCLNQKGPPPLRTFNPTGETLWQQTANYQLE
jgi:hypothetical protein